MRAPVLTLLAILLAILQVTLLLTWACAATAAAEFRIATPDTEVRVQLDPKIASGQDGTPWLNWLETSFAAARGLTGSFPQPEIMVELVGAPGSNEAVAFGQVRRSQPPRIRFHVDPDATLAALKDDWRGYHEFAHLLIPFPGNKDIWFTEGFASYYQYLLQSRSGLIEPEDAWRRLLAGFERGLDDPNGRGQSLRTLSPEMWRKRAFRRVYWTGAAFFLRLDTRLRLASDGEHSLESALSAFHDCCMQQRRRWSAETLVDTLGRLSLPAIWHEEYRATIDAPAEPRFDQALEALGIARSVQGLRFSDEPGAVALRQSIAGPATASGASHRAAAGAD